MGIRLDDLLFREAGDGKTESMERLLSELSPLYERTLLKLEDSRFMVAMVKALAATARTLLDEKKETEAQQIISALDDLKRTVKQRPEAANILRESVAHYVNGKPEQHIPDH